MIAPTGLSRSDRWILTASGCRFNLDAPRAGDVDPEDLAHALSHVCRFAGHVRRFYSVAQHSVLVSTLVPRELALAGLLHDAAEAFTGDVPGPLASSLPGLRDVENRILRAVAVRFSVPPWQLHAPEVREADAVALLTERASLLPPTPHPWAEDLAHVRPLARRVVALPPASARAAFLRRLAALWSPS